MPDISSMTEFLRRVDVRQAAGLKIICRFSQHRRKKKACVDPTLWDVNDWKITDNWIDEKNDDCKITANILLKSNY
jgi:hypothetical protein